MLKKDGKRRLHVLQPSDDGELAVQRPPWQWSVIAGAAAMIAWVPLAMLAGVINRRVAARLGPADDTEAFIKAWEALTPLQRIGFGAVQAGTQLLGFAVACLLGGMLVGRFSGAAGHREAMIAGFGAGAVGALAIGWPMIRSAGPSAWLINAAVLVAAGIVAARVGSGLGQRARSPEEVPRRAGRGRQ